MSIEQPDFEKIQEQESSDIGIEELKNQFEELKELGIENTKYSRENVDSTYENKEEFFEDMTFLRESLGQRFFDAFIKGETIETNNGAFSVESQIPLEDLKNLAEELKTLNAERDVDISSSLVLDQDELKGLESILSGNSAKDELEFLKLQFKESISSSDVLNGESLKPLNEALGSKNDALEFLNKSDDFFNELISSRLNISSEDAISNMATGLTFSFIELLKNADNSIKSTMENLLNDISKGNFQSFFESIKNSSSGLNSILDFFNIIDTNIQNGEESKILMNPNLFKETFISFANGYLNKDDLISKINESTYGENKQFKGLEEDEINNLQETTKGLSQKDKDILNGLNEAQGIKENIGSWFGNSFDNIEKWLSGIMGGALATKVLDYFSPVLERFGIDVASTNENNNQNQENSEDGEIDTNSENTSTQNNNSEVSDYHSSTESIIYKENGDYQLDQANLEQLSFNKRQFIENNFDHAKEAAGRLNLPVSFILSHGALESGWGQSDLSQYNNIFGIKTGENWSGESVTMNTNEEGQGMVAGEFRKYNSPLDSFLDYAELLSTDRYQNGINSNRGLKDLTEREKQNPSTIMQVIHNNGYNTDSESPRKVANIAFSTDSVIV